jgi:DNA-binding NtrC family response regulator
MIPMLSVTWHGLVPPRAVADAIRSAGMEIDRSKAVGPPPLVVFTATSRRVPAPPADHGSWIWLCAAEVPRSRKHEAVLQGAYDVVSLRDSDACRQLVARLQELSVTDPPLPPHDIVVTESEASRRLLTQVARVAPTSMAVLLSGETGTGKEVMARLIHAWSPRRQKRFVPINCAAIPNELMEAELFGYARGAFSGAVQRYDGLLMAAEAGTVFLDEIEDTPLELQVKLLRVLEDRVVSRLGENEWHEVDFRILAATNRDLRPLIEAGLFGSDLYERLAIVSIRVPPLRDRLEDLPALAAHFLSRFAREQARPPIVRIHGDALEAMRNYSWPGNIRELRNVIYETLVYKRAGDELLLSDLPQRILTSEIERPRPTTIDREALARKIGSGTMNLQEEIAELQRVALQEALARSKGNASYAARLLGTVGRGTSRDPGGTVRAMMRRLRFRTR